MLQKRRTFSSEFKSRIVRAALREDKTLAQLAGEFDVHPNQIIEWKKQDQQDNQQLIDRLYRQIGELQVDVNRMKKNQENWGLTVETKRNMLENQPNKAVPSIKRQCELLDLSCSTAYYKSSADPQRKAFELKLLNLIDELYTDWPSRGRYGITDALAQLHGITVNHKRVHRLMGKLGIEAIYPKPNKNTSEARKEHQKYPYLLRNVEITRPDQVWCADIAYIRIDGGFVYLVVVMDWCSRCVLSLELSNMMDVSFCVTALHKALATGRRPEIFNTDQGSQFTSQEFTGLLKSHGIVISMDGVGHAFDNMMVERLWRTVKYEDIYSGLQDAGRGKVWSQQVL